MGDSCGRKRGGSWFRRSGTAACRGGTFVAVLALAGCATVMPWEPDDREQLVTASNGYNTMLRWREFDQACVAFADEAVRGGCRERVPSLKDLQITDIRTIDTAMRADGAEATVAVEIEYYLLPSTAVRKLQERQRWVSSGRPDRKVWRITNPLPDIASP